MLLGQQVSPAEWGVCSAEEDSLKRLVCYDELTAQASSAEWNECATEASIARLKCYDDLASELSTGKWRACAETDDSLERLVCYDELAREVSSADLRACAETDDSLVRLVCYDDLAGGTEPPPAPRPAEAPESAVAPEPAPLLDQPPATTGWQRAVEEIFPGLRVVRGFGHGWTQDPYAQGTWCTYKPGQVERLQHEMPRSEGRLFFASADSGEGWRGFIDGAIGGGSRAAREAARMLGAT